MVGRGAHPGGGLDRQQNDHGKGATTCCFERFVKEEGRRDSFLYSRVRVYRQVTNVSLITVMCRDCRDAGGTIPGPSPARNPDSTSLWAPAARPSHTALSTPCRFWPQAVNRIIIQAGRAGNPAMHSNPYLRPVPLVP